MSHDPIPASKLPPQQQMHLSHGEGTECGIDIRSYAIAEGVQYVTCPTCLIKRLARLRDEEQNVLNRMMFIRLRTVEMEGP